MVDHGDLLWDEESEDDDDCCWLFFLYFVLANQETIKQEDDDCCEGWNGMVTTQIKAPMGNNSCAGLLMD